MKDYVVSELSRKLAENDKRGMLLFSKFTCILIVAPLLSFIVQALESKVDKMYDLLLAMKKN